MLACGVVAAVAVALVPSCVLAQGCAMCKTALDGPPDPVTEAFNVSSMFLMATPYTVVASVGVWIYLASRRRDRHPEHDGDDAVAELE